MSTTTTTSTGRRRRTITAMALGALALVAAACAPDSSNVAPVREVSGAIISLEGTDGGGGSLGVDIMLGPNEYNPCHLQTSPVDPSFQYNDGSYGACTDSAIGRVSYYRTYNGYAPGGAAFAGGIPVNNADTNRCQGASWCNLKDPVLHHDWAKKATAWAIETYPADPKEGGVRVIGRFDARLPDGRAWSGNVGRLRPVREGQPDTFNLWGFVTGGPWPDNRWEVHVFQMPPWNRTTSTGVAQQGFGFARNWGGGVYATKPLPAGNYKVYVWDNHTGQHYIVFRWFGPGAQLDIHPGQPCFGLAGALNPGSETPAC